MSIESPKDLEGLRKAGRVVAMTLRELERSVRPGITTAELDEVARRVIERDGARAAPRLVYGFPGVACISVNDEAVHGVPGERTLREGDLVKFDVTVELDGYFADAARTVPVGSVSDEASRLGECARAAFERAMGVARAGERLNAIGGAVEREVRTRGFAVVRELSGHGVGRSIHEEPTVPNFFDPREKRRLTEGLVLAIEPIVTTGSGRVRTRGDRWTIETVDGSLASHHENTVVITRGRPIVVTTL